MLKVTDAAKLLSVSPQYIKQLLKDNKDYIHHRTHGIKSGMFQLPPETVRKLLNKKNKDYKTTFVTIGIEKGGCGKSLLTCNTAMAAAPYGRRVLIIDLDPEAHITRFFLSPEEQNNCKKIYDVFNDDIYLDDIILKTNREWLDLAPSCPRSRKLDSLIGKANPKKILKNKMRNIAQNYDLVFFDVSSWYARFIESAYLSSDLVIIPTLPDAWCIESVGNTIANIKKSAKDFDVDEPKISVLMNKYNPARSASEESWRTIISMYSEFVLPFQIRDNAQLQNSINDGLSVFDIKSTKEVRSNILALADYISPAVEI